jgi:hypothetical protein
VTDAGPAVSLKYSGERGNPDLKLDGDVGAAGAGATVAVMPGALGEKRAPRERSPSLREETSQRETVWYS